MFNVRNFVVLLMCSHKTNQHPVSGVVHQYCKSASRIDPQLVPRTNNLEANRRRNRVKFASRSTVTLQLKGARSLQGLCAQCGVYPQSRRAHATTRSRLSGHDLKNNDGDLRQARRRRVKCSTSKPTLTPKKSSLPAITNPKLTKSCSAITHHHWQNYSFLDRY